MLRFFGCIFLSVGWFLLDSLDQSRQHLGEIQSLVVVLGKCILIYIVELLGNMQHAAKLCRLLSRLYEIAHIVFDTFAMSHRDGCPYCEAWTTNQLSHQSIIDAREILIECDAKVLCLLSAV